MFGVPPICWLATEIVFVFESVGLPPEQVRLVLALLTTIAVPEVPNFSWSPPWRAICRRSSPPPVYMHDVVADAVAGARRSAAAITASEAPTRTLPMGSAYARMARNASGRGAVPALTAEPPAPSFAPPPSHADR